MEYKIVEIAGAYLTSIERELNELAADGWVLVTVENHRMYLTRKTRVYRERLAPVYDISKRVG